MDEAVRECYHQENCHYNDCLKSSEESQVTQQSSTKKYATKKMELFQFQVELNDDTS